MSLPPPSSAARLGPDGLDLRGPVRARRVAVAFPTRRWRQVLLACLAALAAMPAAPAGAVFDPLPDTSVQTNGTITAFAESGSRIFLGGRFTRVGVPVTGGAVFNAADGSLDPSIPRADKGSVLASVADGAGGWYVGGNFSSIGSVPRGRLAHILADGTVDPSFAPTVNNNVYALLLSGGVLYAGGDFSLVGSPGVARNHVAAFDAATGALLPFAPNITGTVRALALSGATLYAGGTFRIVEGGVTVRSRLAAYDTATSAMTSFNAGLDDADLNEVRTLALSGGTLYVGGLFNSADAGTGAPTSFDPNVNNNVTSIAVSGSTVYAGGTFTLVNAFTARNRLAAFDAATGDRRRRRRL